MYSVFKVNIPRICRSTKLLLGQCLWHVKWKHFIMSRLLFALHNKKPHKSWLGELIIYSGRKHRLVKAKKGSRDHTAHPGPLCFFCSSLFPGFLKWLANLYSRYYFLYMWIALDSLILHGSMLTLLNSPNIWVGYYLFHSVNKETET